MSAIHQLVRTLFSEAESAQGLTPYKIALDIGFDPSQVRRVLQSDRPISDTLLTALASYFGVTFIDSRVAMPSGEITQTAQILDPKNPAEYCRQLRAIVGDERFERIAGAVLADYDKSLKKKKGA